MNHYERKEQRAMEQVQLWLWAMGCIVLAGIAIGIVEWVAQ